MQREQPLGEANEVKEPLMEGGDWGKREKHDLFIL